MLVMRLDNIGDVVMLGPALRAVKETLPEAKLTLLASLAGASARTLLPWIDEVIVYRATWQDVGGRMAFDPERELQLITMLSERQFDAALIFTSFSQTPHVPGYACYLAGIPLRAGLNLHDPFLLLHPGASARARRYPAGRFGTLARLLTRRGWQVLISGVEREAELIEEVLEHAPLACSIFGEPTLAEYAALIEQAALVICNDSLPT
jgi:ADP-heptose:LPS heptosyltransferase